MRSPSWSASSSGTSTRRTCSTRRRNISIGSCSSCVRAPASRRGSSEMRDCGLLGAMFPELNEISCRVTRDFYHKYTVDEHTLLTVRNVERLLNNPRFGADSARSARARAARAVAAVSRRRQGARGRSLHRRRRDGGGDEPRGWGSTTRHADDRLSDPASPEDVAHRVPARYGRARGRPPVRVDVRHRRAAEDARAADAVRRRRREPGHADAVEGRAAVAVCTSTPTTR